MTPERRAAEDEAVADYADRILRRRAATDWPALNRSIIDRWSLTALRRIKERAWAVAYPAQDEETP